MVLLLPKWRGEVTYSSKCKVANSSSHTHTQEQPSIVGHGQEHEDVAETHLHHVQNRLQAVCGPGQGVVLQLPKVMHWNHTKVPNNI